MGNLRLPVEAMMVKTAPPLVPYWIVRDAEGHVVPSSDLRFGFKALGKLQAKPTQQWPRWYGGWPARIAHEKAKWEREEAVERYVRAELALEWTAADQEHFERDHTITPTDWMMRP